MLPLTVSSNDSDRSLGPMHSNLSVSVGHRLAFLV
uniref:Uncharacterized protein n=1 Tax=Anguilla anguilla TaxID=7936 RepID=A0A0E9Q6S7_ANGAN